MKLQMRVAVKPKRSQVVGDDAPVAAGETTERFNDTEAAWLIGRGYAVAVPAEPGRKAEEAAVQRRPKGERR